MESLFSFNIFVRSTGLIFGRNVSLTLLLHQIAFHRKQEQIVMTPNFNDLGQSWRKQTFYFAAFSCDVSLWLIGLYTFIRCGPIKAQIMITVHFHRIKACPFRTKPTSSWWTYHIVHKRICKYYLRVNTFWLKE